jgi:hypothetical protein
MSNYNYSYQAVGPNQSSVIPPPLKQDSRGKRDENSSFETRFTVLHSLLERIDKKMENFIETVAPALVEKLFDAKVEEFYQSKGASEFIHFENQIRGAKNLEPQTIINLVQSRGDIVFGRENIFKIFKDLEILR